ncbi:hypothetical protein T4E_1246 [Trichinella pseudospiralis]|uniref:Uncharacterized protein n=1 Tax=Trichinella pseudospiralis TaxID=6337 RepID=A0A0V0Y9H3_TRIPS|nr:hypothetical protein T4E_1246 [Trichinella pseudospiralis]
MCKKCEKCVSLLKVQIASVCGAKTQRVVFVETTYQMTSTTGLKNETGKAISHQAVGSMGSEKGKRQEDELTDGLASIRSLFADHR